MEFAENANGNPVMQRAKETFMLNTIKTCRLATPFFQKFVIKIVGAAYLQDHLGKVL